MASRYEWHKSAVCYDRKYGYYDVCQNNQCCLKICPKLKEWCGACTCKKDDYRKGYIRCPVRKLRGINMRYIYQFLDKDDVLQSFIIWQAAHRHIVHEVPHLNLSFKQAILRSPKNRSEVDDFNHEWGSHMLATWRRLRFLPWVSGQLVKFEYVRDRKSDSWSATTFVHCDTDSDEYLPEHKAGYGAEVDIQ